MPISNSFPRARASSAIYLNCGACGQMRNPWKPAGRDFRTPSKAGSSYVSGSDGQFPRLTASLLILLPPFLNGDGNTMYLFHEEWLGRGATRYMRCRDKQGSIHRRPSQTASLDRIVFEPKAREQAEYCGPDLDFE
jgi:hypothetical protein